MELFTEGALFAAKYKILKHIDSGGMGHVYLAEDQTLGRKVAIKIIRPSHPDQLPYAKNKSLPDLAQRFLNEARALAQLDDHPNIIHIHDYGQIDGTPYLVMKYFPGEAVTVWGEVKNPSISQWLVVFKQILSALRYAHAQGVFHRDIKPSNVLVRGEAQAPQVKLIDWGLSLAADRPRMTTAGLIIGTFGYTDPALIGNDEATYTPANDLYSVGVLMYRLLCQQDAITIDPQASIDSLLNTCLDNKITPPREHNPQIPEALEQLMLGLLAGDPNQRPQSADEVLKTLATISPPAGDDQALEADFDQLGQTVLSHHSDSDQRQPSLQKPLPSAPPAVQAPPNLAWLDQPVKKPLLSKRNIGIAAGAVVLCCGLAFAQLYKNKNVRLQPEEAKPQAVTAADLDKDVRTAPTPLEKLTNAAKPGGLPAGKMDAYDEKIRNRYSLNTNGQPVLEPNGTLALEPSSAGTRANGAASSKSNGKSDVSKGFRPASVQQYLENKNANKNLPMLNVRIGTRIQAKLLETLDTASDLPVRVALKVPLSADGITLPHGTVFYGRTSLRNNRAYIKFDRAVLSNGSEYQILATAIDADDGHEGLRGRMEYADDADGGGSGKAIETLGKIGSSVASLAPGGNTVSREIKDTMTAEAKEAYQRGAAKPKKRDKMTVRNDTVVDILFSNFKY